MKKLVTILFATMLMGQARAEDNYDFSATCRNGQTLYYKITSENTVAVTHPYYSEYTYDYYYGFPQPSGSVIIPETVSYNEIDYTVTSIGDNAFGCCYNLTSIIIPNSVTSIGYAGFASCNSLVSVSISNSLTSINCSCFLKCDNIKTIVSFAEVPPIITEDWVVFDIYDPFAMLDTIYVPTEAMNAYESASIWNSKEIMPFYNVRATSINDSLGTVQGDSLVLGNNPAIITAVPNDGYHFVKWNDGNTDNPRTYSIAKDTSFTAIFEAHTTVTDTAVAATCTETGLTEGKHCSVCGEVLVAQETIDALGHAEVVDAVVAATCTESGLTEGKHCSVCNEVLVAQTKVPVLGHQFVNYVYNNDATITADGTETATCEHGCGATDTRVKEGTKLPNATAVSEDVANLNIYVHGRTIVVENATDEIRVYDAMGRIVGRDVARNVSTINVDKSGVYIVKIGGTVKRVVVD